MAIRKVISVVSEGSSNPSYDSTKDTLAHIKNIELVMNTLIDEIDDRKVNHDLSKLREPEKSTYDKFIPLLREAKYGSKEYQALRDDMYKEGLRHHFESNRHHPEHFENGLKDMTLVDLLELFSDWLAASMRSDVDFIDGLDMNKSKYNMSDDLIRMFTNTYNEYFLNIEDESYSK